MARHEAAHALVDIALGADEVSARVRPANKGGWKGDSAFPDQLALGHGRIVVMLVGVLAQVKLGTAIEPEGFAGDLTRARDSAEDFLRTNLGEEPTAAQVDATLAVCTVVGARFLESVWSKVEHVAEVLIDAMPEPVHVEELVASDELRVCYNAVRAGLT